MPRELLRHSRGMVIDFDDTLMATRLRRFQALIEACHDFDTDVTVSDIEAHWGKPFIQLIHALAPQADYESFHAHYRQIMRRHPPEVLPGVREMLAKVSHQHTLIGVVTSSSRDLVVQDLEAGSLLPSIWRIWGFEDTSYHKPDPRVLEAPLRELAARGVHPSQTVYCGDSVADLLVANGNAIAFVAVLTGTATRDQFLGCGLDDQCIVDSFSVLYSDC